MNIDKQISSAITILNQGGIIVFPTDTAFGIGCRMDNEGAIKRLYKIRNRPQTQPTSILVSSYEMAERYWTPLSDVVRRLVGDYWPGALTIIYTANAENTPPFIESESENTGIRMPDHQTILKIIRDCDVPILGPSANFHGLPSPYTDKDLDPELTKLVDYVVQGECTYKKESTVIDCTASPWKIIRQGACAIDTNKYQYET